MMVGVKAIYSLLFFGYIAALPDKIPIGCFIEAHDSLDLFFKSVDTVNNDNNVLPKTKLIPHVVNVSNVGSYRAKWKVCNLTKIGVAALFGPEQAVAASYVQSVSEVMEIPQFRVTPNVDKTSHSLSVDLHPHPDMLSKAYSALIIAWGWKSFTIISDKGSEKFKVLLKTSLPPLLLLSIRFRLLPSMEGDYRSFLNEIKLSGEINFVLDCEYHKIRNILQMTQQVGMFSDSHSYLITSLDFHLLNLEEFQFTNTHVASLRLIDPQRSLKVLSSRTKGNMYIKTEPTLLFDAVTLYAHALHDIDKSENIQVFPLSCGYKEEYTHGSYLINHIKDMCVEGLSGPIYFDSDQIRTNFTLDVMELGIDGINKTGTWHSTSGLKYERPEKKKELNTPQSKALVVVTKLKIPYCIKKYEYRYSNDTEELEGYVIDVIDKISKMINMKYTIKLVSDDKYGVYKLVTKKWLGMIGDLLEKRADVAIADLTITDNRLKVVDFTAPFMDVKISLLCYKPPVQGRNLLIFFNAFSLKNVAVYHRCLLRRRLFILLTGLKANQDKPIMKITFFKCLFYTMTCFMQQNQVFLPPWNNTKLLYFIWRCFSFIFIGIYVLWTCIYLKTADEAPIAPVQNIQDLKTLSAIQYGAVTEGSTIDVMQESNDPMAAYILSSLTSVPSYSEGVQRVLHGKGSFAMLMETPTLDYIVRSNGYLARHDWTLDIKGYGIALPRDSMYYDAINAAVLKLREDGTLHRLKIKWWENMTCDDDADTKTCSHKYFWN
ncbi:hypothetical protein ACJJTC_006510 [Scirpophaga incertulas]